MYVTLSSPFDLLLYITPLYRVNQNVRLGFSIRCYNKPVLLHYYTELIF